MTQYFRASSTTALKRTTLPPKTSTTSKTTTLKSTPKSTLKSSFNSTSKSTTTKSKLSETQNTSQHPKITEHTQTEINNEKDLKIKELSAQINDLENKNKMLIEATEKLSTEIAEKDKIIEETKQVLIFPLIFKMILYIFIKYNTFSL